MACISNRADAVQSLKMFSVGLTAAMIFPKRLKSNVIWSIFLIFLIGKGFLRFLGQEVN